MNKIRKFYKNKPVRFFELFAIIFSLTAILIQVSFIYYRLFPQIKLQPFVPLHYNIHSGVDLIGPWWQIFTIPFFGLLVLLFNLGMGRIMEKRDSTVSIFYACVTVVTQIILFIATIFVVALNVSYYG